MYTVERKSGSEWTRLPKLDSHDLQQARHDAEKAVESTGEPHRILAERGTIVWCSGCPDCPNIPLPAAPARVTAAGTTHPNPWNP